MNNTTHTFPIVLTSLFLLLCSHFHYAQPLVNEDNQWTYEGFNLSPNPYFYSHRIGEDSMINNVSWHKVYYSQDTLGPNWVFNGQLMRQDSQKVYLKEANADEYVLYNFRLAVGDSISLPLFSSQCVLYVDAIDSVQLNDGTMRKRMLMRTAFDVFQTWIEGIGSTNGGGLITHPQVCATDYFENLLCFYAAGSLQFPQSPTSCFLTNTEALIPSDALKIYPNPVINQLHVNLELQFPRHVQLHIFDLQAKQVWLHDFGTLGMGKHQIRQSIPALPSGLYFLQFLLDQALITQKIRITSSP